MAIYKTTKLICGFISSMGRVYCINSISTYRDNVGHDSHDALESDVDLVVLLLLLLGANLGAQLM
jgi:hypothetical protein